MHTRKQVHAKAILVVNSMTNAQPRNGKSSACIADKCAKLHTRCLSMHYILKIPMDCNEGVELGPALWPRLVGTRKAM